MVGIIIFVKFLFRAVIPDKPRWVMEEEERQKVQQEVIKGNSEVKLIPSKVEKEINEVQGKAKAKINEYRGKLEKSEKKIKELESERERIKQQLKDKMLNSTPSNSAFQQSPQEYKAKALSLFLKTFQTIERDLLLIRLEEIAKYENDALFICDECHKAKAILECLDCKENYCKMFFSLSD